MTMKMRKHLLIATAALTVGATWVPASAHAEERCRGLVATPMTIGVAGQDVVTTPGGFVNVCVTVEVDDPADILNVRHLPSVSIDGFDPGQGSVDPNNFTVWVNHNGPPVSAVTISYEIDGDADSHTVAVPLPSGPGSVCVFHMGAQTNPGGCLLYVV